MSCLRLRSTYEGRSKRGKGSEKQPTLRQRKRQDVGQELPKVHTGQLPLFCFPCRRMKITICRPLLTSYFRVALGARVRVRVKSSRLGTVPTVEGGCWEDVPRPLEMCRFGRNPGSTISGLCPWTITTVRLGLSLGLGMFYSASSKRQWAVCGGCHATCDDGCMSWR
jgi:hypothetical protein